MKLTSIASVLALSFFCLTPSICEAAPKPYQAIQRAATDITIEATRLGHVINSLQRLLDVIPDGLYLPKKNQRDMIPPILGATAALTASLDFIDGQVVYMRTAAIASGAEGILAETAELEALLKAAPKGNEISEVVLRLTKAVGAGQVTEIVKRVAEAQGLLKQLETTVSALRDAGPCIRREIQELDE